MKTEELLKQLKDEEIFHLGIICGDIKGKKSNELLEKIAENISLLSKETYETSKLENIYWEYCSFLVYKKTYKKRLKTAINRDGGDIFDEIQFIECELNLLFNLLHAGTLKTYHSDLKIPFEKKIRFLEKKKSELTTKIDDFLLDFSDSNAKNKIIYLHELGILAFLKQKSPFNASTNKLATILSAITGINPTSIQSYINPIYSPQASQNKNPLLDRDAVAKVKKTIANL